MFKKLMKVATVMVIAIGLTSSAKALTFSTNILTGQQAYILLSTNCSVYSIQLLSAINPVTVDFYDSAQITAPAFGTNYTNAAFVSTVSYASNAVVTANIGATGFTNYLTNSGIYTLLVTNAAATNVLPKMVSLAVGANLSIQSDVDITFARGVSVRPTTNVTIILGYKPY